MLPEDPFNFNRWPHLLQQDAASALESSSHLLMVCPVCKQPWYKVGRSEYPRLTPEQLASLGTTLQVDVQALYLLPRAICTICSALHLGGMFSVEAYPHARGYRFLWESVSPRRIQLLAMICRGEKELALDALVQMTPERFAEPGGETLSVLAWLEACPSPPSVQIVSEEQSHYLARSFPPASTVDGSLRCWRGYAWGTSCPPLGGRTLVLLAVTTRCDALPPLFSLRMGWQVLARAMRVVL